MKSLMMALRCRDGQVALLGSAVGILIASVGGSLLKDTTLWCDIVVIAGSVFSLVGVEQFCRLLVKFQEENGER